MTFGFTTPRLFDRQLTLTVSTRIALRSKTPDRFYTPESFGVIVMVANHRTNRLRMIGASRHGTMDLRA